MGSAALRRRICHELISPAHLHHLGIAIAAPRFAIPGAQMVCRWRWLRIRTTLAGRGCGVRWSTFPGALRSRRELSLSLTLVLGTWRPPTYVGSRDHSSDGLAAPHYDRSAETCLQRCGGFRRHHRDQRALLLRRP